MYTLPQTKLPDLTGKVKKDQYPFANNGSLADVWKGEYRRDSRAAPIFVAIKVIRNIFSGEEVERWNAKLIREGRVWSMLKHPNITPFIGVCYDLTPHGQSSLISPYYKNKDAVSYLKETPQANRVALLRQIASGLAYLHSQSPPIVHGDMKGSNILINDQGEACLTDFGLSRIIETTGFTTKNLSGTTRHLAYELLLVSSDPELASPTALRVTVATDIWAFGMTALQIIAGRQPFANMDKDAKVILHVIAGGIPDKEAQGMAGSVSLWSALEACWDKTPEKRISMRRMEQYLADLLKKPKYASPR
ncbi:kinase-like protein [Leucogyrophana mollusca]|uniref:Kinase-like protein n=1 Tax=Leucogyrophana mollusca TaxID=85980 RepID=A0ACB8BSR6_9AGAM|nr:kinase-like protein [Leucogyrophana mollusca]